MSEKEHPAAFWYRMYRLISLSLSVTFGIVGLIFLFIPEHVLIFFNKISPYLGLLESPVDGTGFFLILAAAYMYLVTILAFLMYRHPHDHSFPFLLVNAKAASSIISFAFFAFHAQYLIYLTNGVVDGLIAAGVLLLSKTVGRENK